jgi:hypothetical protein
VIETEQELEQSEKLNSDEAAIASTLPTPKRKSRAAELREKAIARDSEPVDQLEDDAEGAGAYALVKLLVSLKTNPMLPAQILLLPRYVAKEGGGSEASGYETFGLIAGINRVSLSNMALILKCYPDMFKSGILEDFGSTPFAQRHVAEQRSLVENCEDIELLLEWREESRNAVVLADIERVFADLNLSDLL